jgi:hypothetical protein
MTLAAVDRLVHHATIFEMNVESYRRRAAIERKRGPGRPPTRATIKTSSRGVLQHNGDRVGEENYDSSSSRRAALELASIVGDLTR